LFPKGSFLVEVTRLASNEGERINRTFVLRSQYTGFLADFAYPSRQLGAAVCDAEVGITILQPGEYAMA
jgi:hypothetical protein